MFRYLSILLTLVLLASCDSFFEKASPLPHNPERPVLPPARDRRFIVDSIRYYFDYWSSKSTYLADETCVVIISNPLDQEWLDTPSPPQEPLYNSSWFSSEDPLLAQIYTDTLRVRTPCYVDDENHIVLGDSLHGFQSFTAELTRAEIDRTIDEICVPPHTETYVYGRYSVSNYCIAYTIWLTETTSNTPVTIEGMWEGSIVNDDFTTRTESHPL